MDYDVCVLGCGAAGLTLTAELLDLAAQHGSLRRVALLEGGNSETSSPGVFREGASPGTFGKLYTDAPASGQDLYRGEVTGWVHEAKADYTTASRRRGFGGTTAIWSGWWLIPERHDFARSLGTDGIPWPIGLDDLLPHYLRTQERFGLGPLLYDDVDAVADLSHGHVAAPQFDGLDIHARVICFKRVAFATLIGGKIAASEHADVYLNANFERFECSLTDGGKEVDCVQALALDSDGQPTRRLRIRARAYVVATGALEATRILLLERNSSPHLGRYFVEHPYIWIAGRYLPQPLPDPVERFLRPKRPVRLPGTAAVIGALSPEPHLLDEEGIGTFRAVLGGSPELPGAVGLCWEQEPQRDSRITLSDSAVDPLGHPRLRLDALELTEKDRATSARALSVVQHALEQIGASAGITRHPEDLLARHSRVVPGNHPMGTTRLAGAQADGVVDPECRVYGYSNLFIASTSTFPSLGHANPTLTLLAVAHRLAATLERSL